MSPLPPTVSAPTTPTMVAATTATPTEAPLTPVPATPSEVPATPTEAMASATSTVTPAPTSTPTTAAVPDIDIIVDNQDPAFSTTGTWFIGDGGQSYNGDCAWAPRGIGNIAYVHPELPTAGAYEVFAWWCGDPNHDQSPRALIQIYPLVGQTAPHQVYVNLQENAGQWHSLGTYYLEQSGFLSVDSYLDGNVVADAFRFLYRSPEHVVISPTPLPTPFPWTTHPPSPLEQLTSCDLHVRLGLTPRFCQGVRFTSMETITFDDCQAFPRDGCSGTREGWRVQVQYQDLVVMYHVSQDYKFVAIESPAALANRQLAYLHGRQGDRFFWVYHYPDDTWHIAGADIDRTYAAQLPLDGEVLATLRSFVQTYSSITFETADGLRLQLYGLGEGVELFEEDRSRLATLAAELATAIW